MVTIGRNWTLLLPALSLFVAPACGDDGSGGTTDNASSTGTGGTTTTTTDPDPTTTTTTTTTTDPTTGPATTDDTSAGTTTIDPTDGDTNTSSSGDQTDTGDTTAGESTGGFNPADIPEIPDDPEPSSARHKPVPVGTDGAPQGYWEYTPPGYGGGELYPLLVFLHGIGENGNGDSELDKVTAHGPPKLIKQDNWPNDRPFVVLSAQHPGGGCPSPTEVHDFLQFAIDHYDINPGRVYLTGLSCGAIGSWNYLGEHLDSQIVAMVPIAGDGKGAFGKAGCDLGKVPLWAFHGDVDGSVNVSGTVEPITGLQMCDPKPEAEMVIYPGVGHDSWTQTYDGSAGHDIYAWLLEHYKM